MRPEYPHNFDSVNCLHARSEQILPCSMLKLGEECGNDAINILISNRAGGDFHVIAVCEWCWQEVEWSGEETTAYWRERQREWGVR